jgi:hypothetical protein
METVCVCVCARSNSLPQQYADLFWLHMRKEKERERERDERTHESLVFSFSLAFFSSYPFLRSIKQFSSMVVFFSFLLACMLFSLRSSSAAAVAVVYVCVCVHISIYAHTH